MTEILARTVNAQLEAVFQGHDARTAEIAREMERLENQASHLVRVSCDRGDSPAVRAELPIAAWGQNGSSRRYCGTAWEQNGSRKHEGVSDLIANPSYCLVAGARNHLQANRSLGFCFEIPI